MGQVGPHEVEVIGLEGFNPVTDVADAPAAQNQGDFGFRMAVPDGPKGRFVKSPGEEWLPLQQRYRFVEGLGIEMGVHGEVLNEYNKKIQYHLPFGPQIESNRPEKREPLQPERFDYALPLNNRNTDSSLPILTEVVPIGWTGSGDELYISVGCQVFASCENG